MKKVVILLFCLCNVVIGFCQFPANPVQSNPNTNNIFNGAITANKGAVIGVYKDTTAANADTYVKTVPNIIITTSDNSFWKRDSTATVWVSIGGQGSQKIPGGAITSLPAIGNNPGVNIYSSDFIVSQFYASQPPTASLSGGGTYEFTVTGSTNKVLNWTAGRQSATNPISSIVVGGVTQVFAYPNTGNTVAGIKTVNVQNNITSTFSNVVTTDDNKIAIATTTFLWQNKIYAGFVTSATPTDADIYTALNGNIGGVFSSTRNQAGNLSTPSSSKFVVFASPANYGIPNIVINGLGVTYNQTTRSFTNASGGISSYIIAVSPFPTAGQIDTYLVN